MNMQIPKTIWMYWDQGEKNLPFLVRQCVESWRYKNPEWCLNLIDRQTVNDVVDISEFSDRPDIALQALTDIIRVKLLSEIGGVWADATLYCVKPLDEWLALYIKDYFFAFSSKKKERLMTTWFLAGNNQSRLLCAWTNEILSYWRKNTFSPVGYWKRQALRKLTSLRKRKILSNNIWFSNLVLNKLRVYPYPINMYLFEQAIDRDPSLKNIWFDREMLFDAPAESLQNVFGMNNKTTPASVSFFLTTSTPVHKLNWRQDLGHAEKESNFYYLLHDMENGGLN